MGMFQVFARCSRGHLFTTVWLPDMSLKAIRLGPWRVQRCPVGNHLTIVRRLDPETLTPEEYHEAYTHRDSRVP